MLKRRLGTPEVEFTDDIRSNLYRMLIRLESEVVKMVKTDLEAIAIKTVKEKVYDVKRMIEFLFNELQANKLVIHTKATNKKSIGIAERCGFTKEACIREGGRTNEGEIVDMLYFGLLKSEYGVSC